MCPDAVILRAGPHRRHAGKQKMIDPEVLLLTAPGGLVTFTDANGSKITNTRDCMAIDVNSEITPATGVGGATGRTFQHGSGCGTFIDSQNGRMKTARHGVATQRRETGRD